MQSGDVSSNWSPPVFRPLSDSQALAALDREHEIILLGGGVGSGKTVLHGIDALRRSESETDVKHGIFTNTQTQLEKEVIPSIQERFIAAGYEEPVYDRRPPMSWVRDWVRRGIAVPSFPRYRGVLVAPTGYHAVTGTLSNARSISQNDTLQFGSARIEEATNIEWTGIETILERVRCSTGGGEHCARNHHHQTFLIFNPPRGGAHPWLFTFLDQLEEGAKSFYHALEPGAECKCPREHGLELNHRDWPLLRKGIGTAIWYQSRTSENTFLDPRYRERLAANMSKDTARRRLDGEIVRETSGGAYTEFSNENVVPVRYDPDKALWLCLDFNLQPRAAVFAQQLNPGEYPMEHHRDGLTHVGVLGEFFYAGEMSDRRFAESLVRGDRGSGCDTQARYRSEEWRGFPPPCDDSCEQPCRRGHWNGLRGHRGRIVAYGDQRGTHRSSHGDNLESSWAIVDQVFRMLSRYSKDVPEDQPSPRARVDSVNGKLCNALDQRSLWIDPRCEELIRDLEQVQWDETGLALREWRRGNRGNEWMRTHLSDGLGYMVHRRFPLGHETRPLDPVLNLNFDAIEPPRMR